jgi:hypothetical protein
MTRFVKRIERPWQTIALALVVVICVLIAMELLSVYFPAFGNPIVRTAGALVALGLVLAPRRRS